MRRYLVIAVGLIAAAVLAIGPATSLATSESAHKSGAVTIQSWLLASPSSTGLAGTVKACFRLSGAFADQGGKPTWSNRSYASTSSPKDACRDWTPVGGFNFTPPARGDASPLYAVHTLTGPKGQIFITFAGTYNLVSTFLGSGTWVVTGGTGAYVGIRGEGTWSADASTFPYIRHTEVGTLSR